MFLEKQRIADPGSAQARNELITNDPALRQKYLEQAGGGAQTQLLLQGLTTKGSAEQQMLNAAFNKIGVDAATFENVKKLATGATLEQRNLDRFNKIEGQVNENRLMESSQIVANAGKIADTALLNTRSSNLL